MRDHLTTAVTVVGAAAIGAAILFVLFGHPRHVVPVRQAAVEQEYGSK